MTDEQIDALEAGDAINMEICEIIGVSSWETMENGRGFDPSGDWASAMLAAERFGLFAVTKYACVLRWWGDEGWAVHNDSQWVAHDHSGPLAISRAILRLAPKPPYGDWCRDPKACDGKGYCPLDPTCGD